MFTGIIQTLGTVAAWEGSRLFLKVPAGIWEDPILVGESIAINGCCLTVVDMRDLLGFDLSEETLARTALSDLIPGAEVNLERALRVGDRLGGHIVQGHVDGVGSLISRTTQAGSDTMRFQIPQEGSWFLAEKGSITLDGVSLTVIHPVKNAFDVAVIPHTLSATTLGSLAVGADVNVEYDVLAKHVARLLSNVDGSGMGF